MNREPVEIERRNVSKARRDKILAGQSHVCKRANCEETATDVDHILPLWVGGTNDDSNLEGLCPGCHKRKTSAEAKARAKVNRIDKKIEGRMKPKKAIPVRADPWPKGRKIPSRPFR